MYYEITIFKAIILRYFGAGYGNWFDSAINDYGSRRAYVR